MKLKKLIQVIKNKLRGGETAEQLRARGVKVGENLNVYNSLIDGKHGFLITIGNNVTITGARILAHDGSMKKFLGYSKIARVTIGDNVFIGQGSIVLPGVTIGNNVIVGAGAVISRNVPDNSIVVGNPQQIVGTFDDFIAKHKAKMETCPVYHSKGVEEPEEVRNKMFNELENTIGYDL